MKHISEYISERFADKVEETPRYACAQGLYQIANCFICRAEIRVTGRNNNEIEAKMAMNPRGCCSPECAAKRDNSPENVEFSRRKWLAIVPPAYQTQDDGRNPKITAIAKDWRKAANGATFLILLGQSRKGKTFCAYACLKREIMARRTVAVYRVAELSATMSALFRDDPEDYEDLLTRLRRVDCLVLDDIDKAVMTDRFAQQMFDLIDHRAAYKLGTIVTANISMADFRKSLERTHASYAPLVNRIVESGHIETF